MKKYILIYHKEDNDGLFSMGIIYNYLLHELHINADDIDLCGSDYNDMSLMNADDIIEQYENIILTDISFQAKVMKHIYESFTNRFIWIDHHAPIIKQSYEDNFDCINGLRDTSRSAILNAYKFLYDPFDEKYNNKQLPSLFRILSAWDSFSYEREGYKLDYVRNVNVGTTIKYELNPNTTIDLVYRIIYEDRYAYSENFIYDLHYLGCTINKAKDVENENIIKMSGDLTWNVDGESACALFIQGPSNSIMFKSVKDKVKRGIVFKRNSNGTWTISLYNTDVKYDKEFHCGEFMKKHYKGGGHAGAAGCQVTEAKFIKLLKSKML